MKNLLYFALFPTVYLGYFFNLNWLILLFYFSLVIFSVVNLDTSLRFFVFLFLKDISITFGIFAIMMKTDSRRPLVYGLLGDSNVNFFLGTPGGKCLKLLYVLEVSLRGFRDQIKLVSTNPLFGKLQTERNIGVNLCCLWFVVV